jgi:hypothetical protein
MSSEQALIKAKDKEIEILRRRLEGLVKDDGQSDISVNADQVQNVSIFPYILPQCADLSAGRFSRCDGSSQEQASYSASQAQYTSLDL